VRDEIIDYVIRNRVSTTEVADALGKQGVWAGPQPLTPDFHVAGPIFPIFTAHGSNHTVHDQMRDAPRDSIVVVFTEDCEDRAILGELVARFALLYRGATALVVDGLVRDTARLRRERFPVWASGVTPLGCVNEFRGDFDSGRRAELEAAYEGGVAVCDDGGVVLIPADRVNEDMLRRLELIELVEDVWAFCLNTLKWDTKDIVCDRRYLREPHLLPPALTEQLESFRDLLQG
jgi:4-hydroxy-4-methyl-2-oxoglutarate aldolase